MYRSISYAECLSSEMKSLGIVSIPVAVCAQLLEQNNEHNRVMQPGQVALNERRMTAPAQWQVSLDHMVSIATDNHLNNGQHRLQAAINTDTPLIVHLCVGCKPEAREGVDVNCARNTEAVNILGALDFWVLSLVLSSKIHCAAKSLYAS